MSWMELTLNTTHEAVDWVCTLLATTDDVHDLQLTPYTGAGDADIELAELGDPTSLPWTFTILFYIPYDSRVRARVEAIAERLAPLYRTGLTTEIETTIVDEKTLAVPSETGFMLRIGQRFVVLTPDAIYESDAVNDIPLRLKTSLAFGSGLHPATQVSLKLLEQHVTPEMNVLDLGSGSGILSVAMAKMGAQVLALDNDSAAVLSTQEMVRRNGVEQQVTVLAGSLGRGSHLGHWMGGELPSPTPTIDRTATFDLIVANILARVHIDLASDFHRALRSSHDQAGLLITSGFTTDHEEDVAIALSAAGFEAVGCERLGEWVALAYRLA